MSKHFGDGDYVRTRTGRTGVVRDWHFDYEHDETGSVSALTVYAVEFRDTWGRTHSEPWPETHLTDGSMLDLLI